jgi:hypothetical protein
MVDLAIGEVLLSLLPWLISHS